MGVGDTETRSRSTELVRNEGVNWANAECTERTGDHVLWRTHRKAPIENDIVAASPSPGTTRKVALTRTRVVSAARAVGSSCTGACRQKDYWLVVPFLLNDFFF